MTRIIPAAAFESLRLICRGCNFGLLIPLDAKAVPQQCPACLRDLPGDQMLALARGLRWIKDASAKVELGFDAALEAVEERQ